MSIQFESLQQSTRFHNPLKNGELDIQNIEVRLDPLTGHQAVFNPWLEGKSQVLFPPTNFDYWEERAVATRETCFMCEERWRKTTPRFEESFVEGGRFIRGDTVLFPNLFPLAAHHAVIMVGSQHWRKLNELPAELLRDAIENVLAYFRRCYEADPQIRHFTFNANYQLPSGASAVHPHYQLLGAPHPATQEKRLRILCARYYSLYRTNYFNDLVETERQRGERWIGEVGPSRWFTAYAPTGANEVQAVWPECRHLLEWGEEEAAAMAEGLARVLTAYHDRSHSTYNFTVFGGPADNSDDGSFRCFLRLFTRQNVVPHHRTDDYYFQKLLGNEIITTRPEELASHIREYF